MNKKTIARLVGGMIILFNLWLIGEYNLKGIPVLLLTFGVAIALEYLVVRQIRNDEVIPDQGQGENELYWYYKNSTGTYGPVAESDLIKIIKSGSLDAGTLLRAQGLDDWQNLPDLQTLISCLNDR